MLLSKKQGKWGLIDKGGNEILAPRFDHIEPFKDGIARVHEGRRIGYINRAGKFIWEPTS